MSLFLSDREDQVRQSNETLLVGRINPDVLLKALEISYVHFKDYKDYKGYLCIGHWLLLIFSISMMS